MTEMFCQCSQLEELDVSNFNTGNVLYMQEMFYYCSSLKRLDLRNFDTGKVLTMPFMFEGCTGLERIDMSKFNTSSLENMNGMFHGCESLTSLDLSSFDTQEVSNMDHLFFNCNSLATIYVGDKWSTSNVDERYSYFLFNGCNKLVGGAGTKYSDTTYDHLLYARIDGGPSSETPGYLTYKEPSGISTGNLQVISDKSQVTSDEWNTIDGKKIGGKPTKRGVYIHNGKKVVVR
jgi:surface protein